MALVLERGTEKLEFLMSETPGLEVRETVRQQERMSVSYSTNIFVQTPRVFRDGFPIPPIETMK